MIVASAVIPRDPAGVDTEGIVRLAGGGFWLSEEYGPSLIRVGADGVVSERLVPRGAGIATHAYRVREALPPVFFRRVQNRGFESLALSKDQRFLFTSIQSPLAHPLPATAKTSRVARVLKLDADSGTVLGEYAVILEEASVFGAASQSDVKISGAIWVGEDRLLLDQRTDEAAKIYEMDLRKATNILGTAWDDLDHEALEAQSPLELSGKGVVAATSKLLLDLSALATSLPVKIEGIALADDRTLVAGNDNEFAFNGCDSAQNAVPVDRPSELLFIRFPHRLR